MATVWFRKLIPAIWTRRKKKTGGCGKNKKRVDDRICLSLRLERLNPFLKGFSRFHWDKINSLLNHKAGTALEVQEALWIVQGQDNLADASKPAIAAMAQNAMTNGAGFVPGAGQIIAVLLYSDGIGIRYDEMQETIVELPIPNRGGPGTGTPGYWKNHLDAWPVNSITIGEDTCSNRNIRDEFFLSQL